MSLNSHIEWTDATWNPVRGCTKISPGCKHCYADLRRAVPRRARPPLRAGVRSAAGAGETVRAAGLESVADGVRELHERPLPRGCARRVRGGRCPVMQMAEWHTF